MYICMLILYYCDNCNCAYREEVLAVHVPREDDEWLLYETAKLTQFTRLYPPVRKTRNQLTLTAASTATAATTDRGEVGSLSSNSAMHPGEEQDDDEDEEAGPAAGSSNSTKHSNNSSTAGAGREKFKAASYEEIMFQVYIHHLYITHTLVVLVSLTEWPCSYRYI